MNNRVIPALLCAAALAFACGPHPHSSAQTVTTAGTARHRGRVASTIPAIASSLDVRTAEPVTFTLHVTNKGPKLVELSFPSGQTHDFSVVDGLGHEVWRWSNDRMFTQSLQNKQISVGDTVDYEASMPRRGLHGTYTVVATLRSSTHPVTQQVAFTVP